MGGCNFDNVASCGRVGMLVSPDLGIVRMVQNVVVFGNVWVVVVVINQILRLCWIGIDDLVIIRSVVGPGMRCSDMR